MTPIGIIKMLDTDKKQRENFAEEVVSKVLNGYVNPVEMHVNLKCVEDIINRIKEHKDFKEAVLNEAAKFGKGYAFHNATIQTRSLAGKYDYSHDDEYNRLTQALKARQGYLKALPVEGKQIVDKDGIVTIDMPPFYSPGGESLFVTLK